jgi:hypothetical protein
VLHEKTESSDLGCTAISGEQPTQLSCIIPRRSELARHFYVSHGASLRCLPATGSRLENTLILRREQNSSEADERASTSSDATTSGTDGEELAVELAKIANDVKVECSLLLCPSIH